MLNTTVLTVDLAAKFSAWMVRDLAASGLGIKHQDNSIGRTPFQVVDAIAATSLRFNPGLILIEDVPYGLKQQSMFKGVLRLQGVILRALSHDRIVPGLGREQVPTLDVTWFINPSTWQNSFPGVSRGPAADRIEAARSHAYILGYEPPNLLGDYLSTLPEGKKVFKKDTDPLAKVMTDHVDAFLMSEFVKKHGNSIYDNKGVQPPSL